MTTGNRHLSEELHELLDGRLDSEARVKAEAHLKLCEQCGWELNALRWTKQLALQNYAADRIPARLDENILTTLDVEARALNTPGHRIWWPQRKSILAYSLVLFGAIAVVVAFFILREPKPNTPEIAIQPQLPSQTTTPSEINLPAEVSHDYRNYKDEKLPLLLKTKNVATMEKYFVTQGITFETRVFDLAMMDYRLVGGRIHKLMDRESALFVYRGKGNEILICQMYDGQIAELPPGAELRENDGVRFYIYRVNGLTAIFWQEGEVTCVLTSDVDSEKIVQLAFAKAVKI